MTLASWRMMLDPSRAMEGEPYLLATARRPVARVSAATAERLGLVEGGGARLHGAAGHSAVLPVHVAPGMVDDVIWVPTLAAGLSVPALGLAAGQPVRVESAELPATPQPGEQVRVGEGAVPEVDAATETQGGAS